MTAARLILLLLLILVAVVLVVVLLRRGSAQRDAQRVEAAGLRSEADTLAATMTGQTAFAEQAAERAEVARVEAERKAAEAARLEAEAAEHRAAVEATQRDYETTMRRADDLDPDVKESTFAPVEPEAAVDEPAPAVAGSTDAAPAPTADGAPAAADGDETLMTRAERREAREAELAGGLAPSAAASVPAAGAAGAAAAGAAGASAWGARDDEDAGSSSERIASAADFRDDVGDVPGDEGEAHDETAAQDETPEVYPPADRGTGTGMSDDARTDTAEHTHDDGLGAGGAAAAVTAGAGGADPATRGHDDDAPAGSGQHTNPLDEPDATTERTHDLSRDVESPRGEWGGPPQDESADAARDASAAASNDEPADLTVIGEPEAYAATEPVMAADQSPPVTPEGVGAHDQAPGDDAIDASTGDDQTVSEPSDDHAPAEAGAAVAETDDTDRSAADRAEEPVEERFDPTPTRDWAADEGELLEENHDRGERLEAERTELAHQEGDATVADDSTAADDSTVAHDATVADDAGGATASDDVATHAAASRDTASDEPASEGSSSDEPAAEERAGRRISDFHELRDGGFGVGSAAPLDDGAQPLDHPVQGYRDTMTYRVPGDAGYDSAEPHVWFYDEGAAERSGFRRSEG